MYLHSYQSLIWNQIVSRRVREFGLKVLPGDLVKITYEDAADDRTQQIANNEGVVDDDEEEYDQSLAEFGGGRIQVRALSEQEVAEASIFDVLYPLPGDDIRLPANQVAEWYKEFLQADGYSMSSFGKVHKKYGMYGSYRYMLERPGDVSWRTLHYSDPDQDLLQTELSELRKQPPPPLDPDGPLKAIVLEFNLSVCCYATMAVRELTKCDTSTGNQTMLSLQARDESKQNQQESPVNGNSESHQERIDKLSKMKLSEMKLREMITQALFDNAINTICEIGYH